MKKFTSIILSAFMICSVSCSSNDKSSDSGGAQADGNISANGKTVINVAEITTEAYIEEKIISFNAKSDLYEVRTTTYYQPEDQYGSEALNVLTRDILSGNIPDIIIGHPQNLDNLQRNGYLTDLYPLMENYDGVKKDDILPNVLNSLEVDGRLPYIYDRFYCNTYLAKPDHLIVENCTLDDAMAAYENCSDKQKFLSFYDRASDIWDFFLGRLSIEAIDFENYTCDFSGDFKKTLEFLVSQPQPERIRYSDGEVYEANTEGIKWAFFSGINNIAANLFADYSGIGYTITGYPSDMGNSSVSEVVLMFGISESSKNKSGAWEFLSEFFTLNEQKQRSLGNKGIPVTESSINALAYDVPAYIGGSIRSEVTIHSSEDDPYTITDEDLERFLDYVKNTDINIHYNSWLEQTIRSEWLSVYYGEESVDECVENLNRRIGLYLSEKE